MGRQSGRQFKLCSSCFLLLFTVLIIYFGESTVQRVSVEFEEWSEEALAKKLITSRIQQEYNLKKALKLRNSFLQIYNAEFKKFHAPTLSEMSEEGSNSFLHILNESRIWNAIIETSFFIRQSTGNPDKRQFLTKEEWNDTIDVFSYSVTKEDQNQAQKYQKSIFKNISRKSNSEQINFLDYQKSMESFKNNLISRLTKNGSEKQEKQDGDSIFKYLAFEYALYKDCHREESDSEKQSSEEIDKCSEDDKSEFSPMILFLLSDDARWKQFSNMIFKILDINNDSVLEDTEVDSVLLDLEFKDSAINQFQNVLSNFYKRDDKKKINKFDFDQVMIRIRSLLKQFEEEQNGYL